jgi:homoserine dehydrogenase
MGGVTHARDVVFGAIQVSDEVVRSEIILPFVWQRGKHVVTANKALLATHMRELMALLKAHPNVKFAFEAAVCGGEYLVCVCMTRWTNCPRLSC